MDSTLKEIEFVTPKNKYTFFITEFWFLLGPSTYVHGVGRDNFTFRDIEGEVAWINSVQTADFECCEQGYDPYVPIKCRVFLYQLARCCMDIKNGSVAQS
jgi:hypothetical protein